MGRACTGSPQGFRREFRLVSTAVLGFGLCVTVHTLVAFCALGREEHRQGRTGLQAFKPRQKQQNFFRRPLRPSRFEDGPEKVGDGRGEWQGDEGQYNINWQDPNIGRKQGEYKPEEPLDDEWLEPDDVSAVPDEFEDDESEERRPWRRQRPLRRRARTRFMEDGSGSSASSAVQAPDSARAALGRDGGGRGRREPWRPPVFRPGDNNGPPGPGGAFRDRAFAPRRGQSQSWPERQPRQQLRSIELEPPVRPVNLEAMAAKGLPKMNLYQLEPYDFDYYVIRELGLEKQVTKQLRQWIYEKGVQDFLEMKNIALGVRHSLAKLATAGAADWKILAEQESNDGTVKVAYRLPEGHAIESVLMPYQDGRRTACISSQVGCAMGCVFCATGQMGFKRHLTAAEIFEQAARFSARLRRQGLRLTSVVLLGMGEPLANFNNTVKAVHRIHKDLGIGMRHITISTVGLVPEIRRLAEEKLQVTLAISLHAANDEERSKLLPMNKRYPIDEVMQAASDYYEATGRRVSFEWTLIAGENDTPEKAEELGQLIYLRCPGAHVNLIPLNPTNGYAGGPSQQEAVAKFVDKLREFGVEATVRVRRGIDIDAGCGQLAERALEAYEDVEVDQMAVAA